MIRGSTVNSTRLERFVLGSRGDGLVVANFDGYGTRMPKLTAVRFIREAEELSQKEFANWVALSEGTIKKLEGGRRVTNATAQKIFAATGVLPKSMQKNEIPPMTISGPYRKHRGGRTEEEGRGGRACRRSSGEKDFLRRSRGALEGIRQIHSQIEAGPPERARRAHWSRPVGHQRRRTP